MFEDRQTQRGTPDRRRRRDWIAWFWTVLPLAGGALLVPWGADWPRSVALVALWLMGGLTLVLLGIVYGAMAYAPKVVDWTPMDANWTARRGGFGLGRWVHWIAFNLGLVVAPIVAGHPMLAGCFVAFQLLMFGMPDIGGEEAEREPGRPRRVGKAVFWVLYRLFRVAGWCISIVAQAVLMVVLWIAETVDAPLERRRKRRLSRRLRSTFDAPAGSVYFVYSEPHQFDRFLGPGGVLQSAIGGVIARNWRSDIQPGWSTLSKTPLADAERELLHRYRVSNMREHLPFAVVIAADDSLHAFHLSEPYRKRQRDGGAALQDVENRLRLFIAVAD